MSNRYEIREAISKQHKAFVATLAEYHEIARKSAAIYEAFDTETGVVTDLWNIGDLGHRDDE